MMTSQTSLRFLLQVPHMYDWVNHIRIGSFTAILYAGICLVFLIFIPGVELAADTWEADLYTVRDLMRAACARSVPDAAGCPAVCCT